MSISREHVVDGDADDRIRPQRDQGTKLVDLAARAIVTIDDRRDASAIVVERLGDTLNLLRSPIAFRSVEHDRDPEVSSARLLGNVV